MRTSSAGAISSSHHERGVILLTRRGRGVILPRRAERGVTLPRRAQHGVTLMELLIVMTLIALLVAVAYPSAVSGIDGLRLRTTADTVVNFLNTAIDRANRRQQVVELWIAPKDNTLIARSATPGFARRLNIPEPFHITAVRPAAEVAPDEPRRFLMVPGAAMPRISIEISGADGRKRTVTVDPLTGMPRNEVPDSAPAGFAIKALGGGR
jgi:prepilin-type N-terminal cleavage/methylation domain-containing protein